MKNDEPQPQNPPVPPIPDEDVDADYPEPTLTTPGGRFWEIPLDPQQQKALMAPRFWPE